MRVECAPGSRHLAPDASCSPASRGSQMLRRSQPGAEAQSYEMVLALDATPLRFTCTSSEIQHESQFASKQVIGSLELLERVREPGPGVALGHTASQAEVRSQAAPRTSLPITSTEAWMCSFLSTLDATCSGLMPPKLSVGTYILDQGARRTRLRHTPQDSASTEKHLYLGASLGVVRAGKV